MCDNSTKQHGGNFQSFVKESIADDSKVNIKNQNNDYAKDLKDRLKDLHKGNDGGDAKQHAKDYETICAEVIELLFSEYVANLETQQRDGNGINVYDMVARIQPRTSAFWNFIVHEIRSRYLVVECKNYKDKISQREIITTEKYLYAPALRVFALIFTREGENVNAQEMVKRIIRESGKLLLVLSDEDVKKMLDLYIEGGDPSDYLFELADRFFYELA